MLCARSWRYEPSKTRRAKPSLYHLGVADLRMELGLQPHHAAPCGLVGERRCLAHGVMVVGEQRWERGTNGWRIVSEREEAPAK